MDAKLSIESTQTANNVTAEFCGKTTNINRSLALSKVLEPDAAEHLFDSLLPDMVQLALRASELCTKVTSLTNRHWLTGPWHSRSLQQVDPTGHGMIHIMVVQMVRSRHVAIDGHLSDVLKSSWSSASFKCGWWRAMWVSSWKSVMV